jgi:hypothetical protein
MGGFAFAQGADAEGNAPAPVELQSGPAKITKGDKKTSINFEDELIEGTSQKPDLFYIFQKNNIKFKKLIKLRENFLPEMNRAAEDIQRLRGGR